MLSSTVYVCTSVHCTNMPLPNSAKSADLSRRPAKLPSLQTQQTKVAKYIMLARGSDASAMNWPIHSQAIAEVLHAITEVIISLD
eukprot:jgi/Botrbrau1/17548/Bobra.0766s0004.1